MADCLLDDLHSDLHQGEKCPECGHDPYAETPPPVEDLRAWGWAPGGYVFVCQDCPADIDYLVKWDKQGAKRSWRCREHAIAARDAAAALPPVDQRGVHLSHCYQGEYAGTCKYGDHDCPAATPSEQFAKPSPDAKILQWVTERSHPSVATAWTCGLAAITLMWMLRLARFSPELMSGTINGSGHLWVEMGGKYYDPTIGQFGNYPNEGSLPHPLCSSPDAEIEVRRDPDDQDWDKCPRCKTGSLDTGFECNACGFDALPLVHLRDACEQRGDRMHPSGLYEGEINNPIRVQALTSTSSPDAAGSGGEACNQDDSTDFHSAVPTPRQEALARMTALDDEMGLPDELVTPAPNATQTREAELMAALEPFARLLDWYVDGTPDNLLVAGNAVGVGLSTVVTVADLRRAHAALNGRGGA